MSYIDSDEITLEMIIAACHKEHAKRKDGFSLEEKAQCVVLKWVIDLLELLKYKQDNIKK